MFYSTQRNDIRKTYYEVWQKYQNKQPLMALEQQIAEVILDHPEYQGLLSKFENSLHKDYLPEFGETNPFLHMGLHLAIREQVATNRPEGITQIHKLLSRQLASKLEAEHCMMEYLVEAMWQAQRDNTLPDDKKYLRQLQKLITKR